MGFEDIEKRMVKRGPRSPAFLLALAGLALIGLNFVSNEVAWEHADYGGRYSTTYWPAVIGITCLLGSLIAKRYPNVASRMALAFGGLGLIGVNMLLDEGFRVSAERAGQSVYWVSRLPAGIGCMMLIISMTKLGGDLRSRSRS